MSRIRQAVSWLALFAASVGGALLVAWAAIVAPVSPEPFPSASSAAAATPKPTVALGLIVDDALSAVTIFDISTDTILGTVALGTGAYNAFGDCSIAPDGTLGFVTSFNAEVWVIDLATGSLAAGTNPIPISNQGEDTVISADGKYLLVSDGGAPQPISIIDIATRTEVTTLTVAPDHNSVEALANGSVLVTSSLTGDVYRLTLDGAGNLVDTGEVLYSGGEPNNVVAAPDGNSGVVVTRAADQIKSFTIPGLSPVDVRDLSSFMGLSVVINQSGDHVYTRDNGGFVDAFTYNSATAAFGAAPLFSIPISGTSEYYGMDQMAITTDGTKLYVSQPGAVNVYNAHTGSLLRELTDVSIVAPKGICLTSFVDSDGDGVLDAVDACPLLFGIPEENGCPPPGPPLAVGGVVGLLQSGDGPQPAAHGGGNEYTGYIAALAAGAVLVGTSGWYTRRRWLSALSP